MGGRGLGRVYDHIKDIRVLKAWGGGYAERVWGEHCIVLLPLHVCSTFSSKGLWIKDTSLIRTLPVVPATIEMCTKQPLK